jgi:prepilin-type N-terminal cleavage/methylation domain-containing protein
MRFNEQGSSLIELMIATGIIGILMALYISNQTRMERDADLQAAREEGHDQLILTLNMIRKNVKSKLVGTKVEVAGNSFEFSQSLADGSVQKMRAFIRCRAAPGETFTVIAKDPSDSACLSRLDCRGLPYLEIQLEVAGGAIQTKAFPSEQTFERNIKRKAAFGGLGVCVDRQSDSLKVRAVEVLFNRHTPGMTELHLDGMSYQMLDDARNAIEMIR